MAIDVAAVPRAEWSPLPFDGCRDVDGKTVLEQEGLLVAMLRFGKDATIHEHSAEHDVDVVYLEGSGKMSVGGEESIIRVGERVRWPANLNHRLWTEGEEMLTLMIEHPSSA